MHLPYGTRRRRNLEHSGFNGKTPNKFLAGCHGFCVHPKRQSLLLIAAFSLLKNMLASAGGESVNGNRFPIAVPPFGTSLLWDSFPLSQNISSDLPVCLFCVPNILSADGTQKIITALLLTSCLANSPDDV